MIEQSAFTPCERRNLLETNGFSKYFQFWYKERVCFKILRFLCKSTISGALCYVNGKRGLFKGTARSPIIGQCP